MTSPGKGFQTRSRTMHGGREKLPKGKKNGDERRWMEPVVMRGDVLASGHGFLNFPYCLKLDPICSFHLTLDGEIGDAESWRGVNTLQQCTTPGSVLSSVSLEKSLYLSEPP